MMMKECLYCHRQGPLWFLLLELVVVLLAIIFIWVTIGWHVSLWFLASFMVLLAILFWGLAVKVNMLEVRLSFGVGIINKTILREQIAKVEQVRNSWRYGLGIRLTPHGWLWSTSGLDAVELTYHNGKKFRIGTDKPEILLNILDPALNGVKAQ